MVPPVSFSPDEHIVTCVNELNGQSVAGTDSAQCTHESLVKCMYVRVVHTNRALVTAYLCSAPLVYTRISAHAKAVCNMACTRQILNFYMR